MDEDDRRLQRDDPDKWLERALRRGLVTFEPGRTIVLRYVDCSSLGGRKQLCGWCICVASNKLKSARRMRTLDMALDALLG